MQTPYTLNASEPQYSMQNEDSSFIPSVVTRSTRAVMVYFPWNDPRNAISYSAYLLVEHVCLCWLHNAIALVGVPTNLISCLVFYKQGLRDRMVLCLFCLAIVDLLFVVIFYTLGTYCIVGYFRPEIQDWWKWSVRCYVTGVYRAFLFSSGCLTMVIAVERCICVLYPMKAGNLIKTRTMAVLIGSILVAFQLLCLLYPLKLTVSSVKNPLSNSTEYKLSVSELYLNNRQAFDVMENTVIMSVLPFTIYIVVVLSTAVTVIQLKRAVEWRKISSSNSSNNNSTTSQLLLVKMLVAVSCIYILLTSPNVALGVTRSAVAEFAVDRSNSNLFLATHMVYLELSMFNSSINFFVYITQSSRFRKIFSTMMSLRVSEKSSGDPSIDKNSARVAEHFHRHALMQEVSKQA